MKVIVTGVTGQDGAYLSKLLLSKGHNIYGILSPKLKESKDSLAYLGIAGKIDFLYCDLCDKSQVEELLSEVKPEQIFNLAAQSSVGKSFKAPGETLDFNINSVLNLLEAILKADKIIRFFQASSGDMFGKVKKLPVSLESPLNPISPYAVSKAAAHWIVRSYRTTYGIYAASGILFNHESYLRSPDFFCKKVIRQSIEITKGKREFLELGNIDVKRDFGYGPDYVEAMYLTLQQEIPRDYIISSGKSVSLREIVYRVFEILDISRDKIVINPEFYRPEEIEDSYGNNNLTKHFLGWDYNKNFFDVLELLINEELKNYKDN